MCYALPMNLTDTISDNKAWLGLLIATHFTKHEYGDLLPPTYQEDINHPMVKQANAMVAFQILQFLAQTEQRKLLAGKKKRHR
jgi:hypothetical protein